MNHRDVALHERLRAELTALVKEALKTGGPSAVTSEEEGHAFPGGHVFNGFRVAFGGIHLDVVNWGKDEDLVS